MKQTAFNGRLLWRKILTVLSLGAVALTFQACYGSRGVRSDGTVKSADTKEPIQGISVSFDGEYYNSLPENNTYFELTESDGSFRIYLGEKENALLFKDIDGEENGEFLEKRVKWNPKKGPLNVELERKQ
jgi:hypothetical protein